MSNGFHLPLNDAPTEPLSEAQVLDFALRIGWIDDLGVVTPGSTMIDRRALSWWPGYDLIIAQDALWGSNVAAWLLKQGERLIRLRGRSSPIHALNASSKPMLTSDNALAYVGFFCHFVHGEHGPFAIIRTINDSFLPAELDREKIAPFLREPAIVKQAPIAEDENVFSFDIEALVYYGDALFLANFRLFPSGMVEMLADEPLVDKLGAAIALPLSFSVPKAASEATIV